MSLTPTLSAKCTAQLCRHSVPVTQKQSCSQGYMPSVCIPAYIWARYYTPASTCDTRPSELEPCMQTGQPKVMAGIHAWQRNAVVGAALQTFCSWMVTFSDDAMIDLSRLALALATCGCPWLRAESQHLLQVPSHNLRCPSRTDGVSARAMGSMSQALCLTGCRVVPNKSHCLCLCCDQRHSRSDYRTHLVC